MGGDLSFLRSAASPVSSLLDPSDRDFTLLVLSFARRWQQFDWPSCAAHMYCPYRAFCGDMELIAACFHWLASIRRIT